MNLSNQITSSVSTCKNQHNFIHLREKIFAEYNFVYHINDGYSIKELLKFNSKGQLLFQKINSKVKQMNLILVESIFPILLADIALEVFINKISSFSQYVTSRKRIAINDFEYDSDLLKYKLKYFIYFLLFSNIATEQICEGNIEPDNIYYLKNKRKEIQYYSFYERKELQDMLFQEITLKIDMDKSSIANKEANICLKVLFK